MARAKTDPGPFNDDMLDDGILRPVTPSGAPELVEPESFMLDSYEVRMERLRAEIQLGLDDYEAGRVLTFSSAAELYESIMSDIGNLWDEPENTEETEIHRTGGA